MKKLLIALLIFNFKSFGQNLPMHYKDYFGNDLTLSKDKTFIVKHSFDVMVSWQTGNWKMNNDTIYFFPQQIFDTLFCDNKDSIILSTDMIPSRIPCDQSPAFMGYATFQRDSLIPYFLFAESDKLYQLKENGRLLKKAPGRQKRISIRKNRLDKSEIILLSWRKNIPAYYFRQEN